MNHPKKIAFVGTTCIGKTTLLECLRLKFTDNKVVFVEESARIFFRNHPHIKKRFSCKTQGMIQKMVLQSEREAHIKEAQVIFCDRSVLDPVAYVLASGDRKGAERLFKNVSEWLGTYDKFFLLDPEDVVFCQDDIRKENKKERQRLHESFLKLFKEKNIDFELLSGTVEERVKKVEELIF